jgi:type IV secretion system protein VirD4
MRGLPLAYTQSGKRIRYEVRRGWGKRPGEASGIIIGPARSGKGACHRIPMELEFEGSLISLDTKMQGCCITHKRRQRMGQKVGVLAPFPNAIVDPYISHLPHWSINPMDGLNARLPDYGVKCDAIGEGWILPDAQAHDPHWPESGRQVFSGVVMCVNECEPPEKRNLVTVYQKLTGPGFFGYVQEMVAKGNPLINGRLGRLADAHAPKSDEFASILSCVRTALAPMGSQAVMDLFMPSKSRPLLRWQELRKKPMTVYAGLPVQYQSACARVQRMVVTSAIYALLEHTQGLPVLLIMDEFAAMGKMSIIEDTMALSAGLNLTMLPIVQSADQLKGLYGERMNSFLSVAGFQIYLPPRDTFTASLISDLAGMTEFWANSHTVSIDQRTGEPHVSDSISPLGRKLMLPDEVMALGDSDVLLRVAGFPNIILGKNRPYFKDPAYRGMCGKDPYHVQSGFFKRMFS